MKRLIILLSVICSSHAFAAADTLVVEIFKDRGEHYIRAGSQSGLEIGDQLFILGDQIGDSSERRTVAAATVIELWNSIARIHLSKELDPAIDLKFARISTQQKRSTKNTPDTGLRGSVFLDPLGFALFGPTGGFELGAGQFSGILFGRLLSAGALANSLFPNDSEELASGFGLGLRGRVFFGEGLSGPHLGAQVEYIRTTIRNKWIGLETNSQYLVPQIEAGYRFSFNEVYVGPALTIGYASQLNADVNGIDGTDAFVRDVSTVYGSAALEFGLFF